MQPTYSRFNIRLPSELLTGFRAATKERQISGSQLIRDFIQDYVCRWEADRGKAQTVERQAKRISLLEQKLRAAGLDIPREENDSASG